MPLIGHQSEELEITREEVKPTNQPTSHFPIKQYFFFFFPFREVKVENSKELKKPAL